MKIKNIPQSAYSIGGVKEAVLHKFNGIKETPISLQEYADKVDDLWHLCILQLLQRIRENFPLFLKSNLLIEHDLKSFIKTFRVFGHFSSIEFSNGS